VRGKRKREREKDLDVRKKKRTSLERKDPFFGQRDLVPSQVKLVRISTVGSRQ